MEYFFARLWLKVYNLNWKIKKNIHNEGGEKMDHWTLRKSFENIIYKILHTLLSSVF